MKGVVKIFPPNFVSLDSVNVSFKASEIHAIVGENGAGKSTLVKILYGMYGYDSGQIIFRGNPVRFRHPGDAITSGIGMVQQENVLIPDFTVLENIILGVEPTGYLGRVNYHRARTKILGLIDEFTFRINPDAKVRELSIAARQKVEILKLLYRNVSILIMDEPTSMLVPQEIPPLFDELRQLRNKKRTIIFISHDLEEVLDLADRVTVLHKGRNIGTMDTAMASRSSLTHMMVGHKMIYETIKKPKCTGEVILNIFRISYIDNEKRQRLRDISFQVKAGEIVGIAGIEGNGQSELVDIIMGLIRPVQGKVEIQNYDLINLSILERRKLIAFVSQDRISKGSCASAAIKENLLMTHHRLTKRFTNWGGRIINFNQVNSFTDETKIEFDIQMGSGDTAFQTLSGGNQQKVILGRELALPSPLILLDQPTRGLDVSSTNFIHQRILMLRDKNRALLLLSSDLDELFRLSDRILVLYRGQIIANLNTEMTDKEAIGLLMLEGKMHEA